MQRVFSSPARRSVVDSATLPKSVWPSGSKLVPRAGVCPLDNTTYFIYRPSKLNRLAYSFPAKTLEARSRRSGIKRLAKGEATAGHHNSLALVHTQAVKQAPHARHRSDRLRDHVDEIMGSHRHLALAVRCAWRTLFCYRKDFVLAVAHRQRVESHVSMSR
ncbi:hypothetical protein PI125_g22684 [Phytophthora idaei]|nr:hypothetical protein PI125_g22684 [Phytophthora idaei]